MKSIHVTICLLFLTFCVVSSSAAIGEPPKIKSGEEYRLTILGVPADQKRLFDGLYTIDQMGNIEIPLAGPVYVKGMRVERASMAIQISLKERGIITYPTIMLDKQAGIIRPKGLRKKNG